VWKKCEKLLEKQRSSKFIRFFLTGILEGGLRPKYAGQPRPKVISPYALGGAKFISSPWAHKWLATALPPTFGEKMFRSRRYGVSGGENLRKVRKKGS
jgi:hypothetical protein